MIMQVEEGSCGVTDKNGKLLGWYKNEKDIKVFAGSIIYVQMARLTLKSIIA
jgi:hypothetical protein